MNSKQRVVAAIEGREPDRVPVFPLLMHFAADRYGITYRRFASDAAALADAQLNVLDKFNVDAISACSDAFRISADLGGNIVFPENTPPHLTEPLVKNKSDFASLKRPDAGNKHGRMYNRAMAVNAMAKAAGERVMIMGWVDMPFAEVCSLCGVGEIMMMLYENPVLVHKMLEFLTDIVIDFALLQVESGAPIIGAGDAAASLISPAMYREFALPYEKRVVEAVHAKSGMVKIHICGNTSELLEDMVTTDADMFNVDHLVDFDKACKVYGAAGKCFKGNLDPVAEILQASAADVHNKAVDRIRRAAGLRYILSGGCEIPAGVHDDVFTAFCNAPLGV